MTGLLEPDAERVQPQGVARALWRGAVLVAALLAAFIRWGQPHLPSLGAFRFAIVISAGLEVYHRWRRTKGK